MCVTPSNDPAQQMAKLVAGLHAADGRVLVDSFYDGIDEPSATELELAYQAGVERADYLEQAGLPPVGGESGRSAAERLGFRPTLEVNGITSGYNILRVCWIGYQSYGYRRQTCFLFYLS